MENIIFGQIVRAKCGAIGRYIDNDECLYIAALDNTISKDKIDRTKPVSYTKLPLIPFDLLIQYKDVLIDLQGYTVEEILHKKFYQLPIIIIDNETSSKHTLCSFDRKEPKVTLYSPEYGYTSQDISKITILLNK